MTSPARSQNLSDWMVVLTSTLGTMLSVIHIYSMGVFILPIEHDLGWSRGVIAGALTVASVISVVMAPFIGALIDRIGSRRIAIAGVMIYCAALAMLSIVGTSTWHWWAIWFLVGIGSVLTKTTVWIAAIAGRFVERRGLAIAIALCGAGLASAIMPIATNALLLHMGWRSAYLVIGLSAAIITLPLTLLFFKDPPSRRTREAADRIPGLTVRQGLRSSQFVRMAIASFLVYVAIMGLSVHFVPILVSLSVARNTAATLAVSMGVASVCGRLLTGFLLDRLPGHVIGGIGFALPILPCLLLLVFNGSSSSAVLIGSLIGLSLGAETDITAYLSSRYFGLRNFGMLFGCIAGLLSLAAGVGPMIAGLVYDHFHSYRLLIWALIPAFALGGVLIGSLGAYPDFGPVPEEAEDLAEAQTAT